MELIYILTYNCNFRCTYCDIHKREEDMSDAILQQSFMFLGELAGTIEKVKFFGGEPLLKKQQIQEIMGKFPTHFSPKFYVTSNSTLIDEKFADFVSKSGLKLTFSLDGDAYTTDENRKVLSGVHLGSTIIKNTKKYHDIVRVNQVITSKTAARFFENFQSIYELGVREFNFLPEYYRLWTKSGLLELQKGFEEILEFSKTHDLYLVNAENYSETSFFNIGIIIDTDGKIYGTNLILAGIFEKHKPELVVGDVFSGLREDFFEASFQRKYIQKVQDFLENEYTVPVLKSVQYVDAILSNFVNNFDASQRKNKTSG